jgi:hypothetical protein
VFDLGGWKSLSKVRRNVNVPEDSFEPKMHSKDFDGLAELVSSFRRLLRLMYEELTIEMSSVKLLSGPVLSNTKPP